MTDAAPDRAAREPGAAVLPDGLRLGPVHLTVTDLERAVGFYREALGLQTHGRDETMAAMGAGGEDVLVLVEEAGAGPAGRHAGLYHVALLYPSRAELARAALRLAGSRTPIQGASDHGTHEAIYLADPDGNGLELAADRPRALWPDLATQLLTGIRPLDVEGLLGSEPDPPPRRATAGLAVGHLHLHVGGVGRALAFYRDVLGFTPTATLPSAAFVSAGGYHHHLGLNTWRGAGVPPQPPGTVGLRHWTVVLPRADDVTAVRRRLERAGAPVERRDDDVMTRDPWGMALLLTPGAPAP